MDEDLKEHMDIFPFYQLVDMGASYKAQETKWLPAENSSELCGFGFLRNYRESNFFNIRSKLLGWSQKDPWRKNLY